MESKKINKLIAVVVWYNPTEKEVETVKLYNKDVERVIIVDNSNCDHSSLSASIPNADYLPLMANKGIAYALNRGCEKATEAGADWVLTMDQDSQWKSNTVAELVNEACQYDQINQVAIFTPYHDGGPFSHHGDRTIRFMPSRMVMTSGNLLRLCAWKQVNGFREDFFIDCVDDEIDCHLIQQGWSIIRCNNMALNHALGQGAHYLPGTKYSYTPHPAWRYYYIGRNLQRMAQLYHNRSHYYHHRAFKELKRLCFYDWDDKWNKLRHYITGWKEGNQTYPIAYRLVASPQAHSLIEWMHTIPSRFALEGQVIYNARNQIRVMTTPLGTIVNVKRYHAPRGLNRWIYSTIRPSKAQRAYENALLLEQKNIPTPQVLGYILCGNYLLTESYLITQQEPLKHSFYEFRYHSVNGYEQVIKDFAQMTAKMHTQGIMHKDYSPGNILFDTMPDGTTRFSLVDINRMYIGKSISLKDACKNFCRLWGHADFINLLAKEYATARGWNEAIVYQLINRYWRRFWHIKTDADIDLVFDNTPRA